MTAYPDFFHALTGVPPYPYQDRLARGAWPTLLDVPTGVGKTAAVLVAWLWRRLHADPTTGRRLVYCLPMRSLVRQTESVARTFCEAAAASFAARSLPTPTVHALLGGDVDDAWERSPSASTILIGTQDLLLSRALNRGYAMSRYKWPVHFGLLNNDALWVLDETQLMGVGVETSAQLQGLRAGLGTLGPTHTLFMSATLGAAQLETVDHPRPASGWPTLRLEGPDHDNSRVHAIVHARKALARHPLALDRTSDKRHAKALADDIVARHRQRGGLTLVIVNRVARAQELYEALRKHSPGPLGLVHSRFRPEDRRAHEDLLHAPGDRIVVATQAIEAGLDVSARTMVTELAPWPSMVQRFGRCNRDGRTDDAQIHWLDVVPDDKPDLALPYTPTDLDEARVRLAALSDAGPEHLRAVAYDPPPVARPVLRRRDLITLFDTTPDLSGHDVDVSPYVRDTDDTDVRLYWRELSGSPNEILKAGTPYEAPAREELCAVSLASAKSLLTKHVKAPLAAWRWSWEQRRFDRVDGRDVRPGEVLLLPTKAGGYDPTLGFVGAATPEPVPLASPALDQARLTVDDLTHEGDPDTFVRTDGRWVTLAEHLADVESEARGLADELRLEPWAPLLATAGRWHDVGKAHFAFQARLHAGGSPPEADQLWAKSPHRTRTAGPRHAFRHELASALAWLAHSADHEPRSRDLVAYLVAAHHGKVRVSLRALPSEPGPDDRPFARGVWHGDTLPAFAFADGDTIPVTSLDLSLVRLGAEGWLSRVLALRDDPSLGPLRLALLETLVRIADWIASEKEQLRA